jgi:FKBP-type peptidyl-prolyl cis-trans isomerase
MRKLVLVAISFSILLSACDTTGVKKNKVETSEKPKSEYKTEHSDLDKEHAVDGEKKMDNGIIIRWFEHGSGEKVKDGDLIEIDYKVLLKDRTVVDGNHLLKKESMPFMVGFNMQTKGWDIALRELKVGDFAEIIIPSDLARGEKGITGLIPPNSDNILKIKILKKKAPTRSVDGNKVWVFEENVNNKLKFDEGREREFHCMTSSPTNAFYVNTYRMNEPFKLRLEDSGVIPGLKKALINAKKSDRMFVLVPASEAYGVKGYLDVVKSNEDLFYNILVMDVRKD